MAVGQGNDHRIGLRALGLGQGEPQAALGFFQMLDPDRREFRAPQRAGKANEKKRPVAEAAQVGGDRRQDLPQDAGGRRGLLARGKTLARGLTADARQRLRDGHVIGRDRAAGSAVQIADGGPA